MVNETLNYGVPTSQYLTQAYSNIVGSLNFGNSSLGSGLDTPLNFNSMSMNGSIFPGGLGSMYGGAYSGGLTAQDQERLSLMSPEERTKELTKMGRLQMHLDSDLRATSTVLDSQAQNTEAAIADQVGELQRQIKKGESDHIKTAYDKLLQAIRIKYQEAGFTNEDITKMESKIKAEAKQYYYGVAGANLVDDIEKHCDNSFVHGFKQFSFMGLGSFFSSDQSSDDVVSSITGEEKSKSSTPLDWLGKGLAVVLTGGIVGLGVIALLKGIKAIPKKA